MADNQLREKGILCLREGNTLGALSCFEKAYSIDKTADLQSYFAFCIAAERGQITEALRMCEESILREPDNPLHYLNHARIYLKAKRREDAIDSLRKGLSHGDNEEIRLLLEWLGIRKKPVFPFLSRGNFLNKYFGLLLSRLKLR